MGRAKKEFKLCKGMRDDCANFRKDGTCRALTETKLWCSFYKTKEELKRQSETIKDFYDINGVPRPYDKN